MDILEHYLELCQIRDRTRTISFFIFVVAIVFNLVTLILFFTHYEEPFIIDGSLLGLLITSATLSFGSLMLFIYSQVVRYRTFTFERRLVKDGIFGDLRMKIVEKIIKEDSEEGNSEKNKENKDKDESI